MRQPDAALASCNRALQLRPDYPKAHNNRAIALQDLRRFTEARDGFHRALSLAPDHPWLLGSWLHARMQIGDWRDLAAPLAALTSALEQGRPACTPSTLLALLDSPPLQRRAAEAWVRAHCPGAPCPGAPSPPPAGAILSPPRGARIRLGYFSCDLQEHATAYLAAELFELHDRTRFEVLAFSFGPQQEDPMRRRLRAAFDRFLDVRSHSDAQAAQLARELGIDIAVDLKGLTQHNRLGIFWHRAAPIQVSYLGFPGTTAAPFMDYLVADRTLIPAHSRAHYAEKIIYLPDSYQANDRQRPIAERTPSRSQLQLPETAVVFCGFNAPYKITPETFAGWMRILQAAPGSVLWLLSDDPAGAALLRREAEARSVHPERLVFAGRVAMPEHLARLRAADLFLDTFPCNAHTSASDALWAGLPLLTRLGQSFAARVGASLLAAIGLPELVTSTAEQYETTAIELARHPERLARLRQRLQLNRASGALFDSRRFTQQLEDAYAQVHERHQRGLPCEDVFVGSRELTEARTRA